MAKYMVALIAVTCLSGCMTVRTVERGQSKWFVGAVRVVLPDTKGMLSAIDVKVLGAGWDNGPFLGWKAGNWIIADPAQCQMLIVIRSAAAAENAAKVITSLEGQQACIADFTHSLAR